MALATIAVAMLAQDPVITFDKTTHDFGKINEADGRVTTVFTFTNQGMSPLVLSNVRASCGCTTPKWPHNPIEPGQTGEITVTYNPNGRPGKFQKTITVTSNATEQTMRIFIKGEVIPRSAQPVNRYAVTFGELSLKADKIAFGTVNKGETAQKSIEYANQTKENVTVETQDAAYAYAQATLNPIEPGKSGQLMVQFDANACPMYGPVQQTVLLRVNGKADPAYAINVTADVREDFSKLTEDQLLQAPIAEIETEMQMGILAHGKKAKAALRIVNAGSTPLAIRRIIDADNIRFQAVKAPIKAGKKDIKFEVMTQGLEPGDYERQITIITNDPKNPIRTINIHWTIQ